VRGIWRKTTLDSYRTAEPQWETILDIDALSKTENANWVFKGAACLPPEETRCLVTLSNGGKDAVTIVRPAGDAVEVEIKTGRTHQIRIHLSGIGHPVVGDKRYGGLSAPRLMLHAWKLSHPAIGELESRTPF